MEAFQPYLALEVISVLIIFLLFLWWRSWRAGVHKNTVVSKMVTTLMAEKEGRLAAISVVLGDIENEESLARAGKIYQKEKLFYARLIKAMMTGKLEDFSNLSGEIKALVDACLVVESNDIAPDELVSSEVGGATDEQDSNEEAALDSPEEEQQQQELVLDEAMSLADQIFQAEETNQELSVKLSVTSSTLGKLLNEFCLRHDGLETRDLISTTTSNYVVIAHNISKPEENDDEHESEEAELESLNQRKQKLTTAARGATELLILVNKTTSLISDDDELDNVGKQLIQQFESAATSIAVLGEEED